MLYNTFKNTIVIDNYLKTEYAWCRFASRNDLVILYSILKVYSLLNGGRDVTRTVLTP